MTSLAYPCNNHDLAAAARTYFLRTEPEGCSDGLPPWETRMQLLLFTEGKYIRKPVLEQEQAPPYEIMEAPLWLRISLCSFEKYEGLRPDQIYEAQPLPHSAEDLCDNIRDACQRGMTQSRSSHLIHATQQITRLHNWNIWLAAGLIPVDRTDPNFVRLQLCLSPTRSKDIIGKALAGKPLKPEKRAFVRWILIGHQWGYVRSTYISRKSAELKGAPPHTELQYPPGEEKFTACLEAELELDLRRVGIAKLPDSSSSTTGSSKDTTATPTPEISTGNPSRVEDKTVDESGRNQAAGATAAVSEGIATLLTDALQHIITRLSRR